MTILQSGIAQAAAGGGYQIARSLRFNSADTAYLSRTPASNGNRQIWTLSAWVKRSAFSSHMIYGTTYGSVNSEGIRFNTDGTIIIYSDDGNAANLTTTPVYRDSSAWYHVVVAVDTTQATSSNRVKLYVNGTQVTVFGTATYPTQNFIWNTNSTTAQNIGRNPRSAGDLANGYMTEMYMIDGQQLTPTSFGETDTATGVWMPKQVTGMTYGTNGFYLNFSDNSGVTATTLGKDSSGNSNNWTPNNFSVTAGVGNDSLVDSPTNYGTDTGAGGEVRGNYCTLTPLTGTSKGTFSNGNLDFTSNSSNWATVLGTIPVSSGKWYWEVTPQNSLEQMHGILSADTDMSQFSGGIAWVGRYTNGYAYQNLSGTKLNNNASSAYGATYTTNDVIGVALDLTAGTLTFYKNGTSQGTAYTGLSGSFLPAFSLTTNTGANSAVVNFGQRPFAYTAPSGFKALCTQNLPTPAIGATSSTLASKNMNVVTYTGTGASRTITGVGFQPDLVWAKSRSQASNNVLNDAVRGAGLTLQSDLTAAEVNEGSAGLTGFNSDGFTIGGSSGGWNTNAATYVGWAWKGANTTVSNTSGTITSTVSANPTAGISIATYTAPSASGDFTFGHGLGVAPKLFITRFRSTSNWAVYHQSVGADAFLKLNSTDASTSSAGCWGTGPTSSLITVKQSAILGAAGDCISYAFAEVAGFSKFGSYTGNGSADGSFVYTGFRPRWVLIKQTSGAGGAWELFDTARNAYNEANLLLEPNSSGAEATASGYVLDFLSNGFKLRGTGSGVNGSGATYIYAAFSESPFNYSRAR